MKNRYFDSELSHYAIFFSKFANYLFLVDSTRLPTLAALLIMSTYLQCTCWHNLRSFKRIHGIVNSLDEGSSKLLDRRLGHQFRRILLTTLLNFMAGVLMPCLFRHTLLTITATLTTKLIIQTIFEATFDPFHLFAESQKWRLGLKREHSATNIRSITINLTSFIAAFLISVLVYCLGMDFGEPLISQVFALASIFCVKARLGDAIQMRV